MLTYRRPKRVEIVAIAALAISLGADGAFGDDSKLREEASSVFGVIKVASSDMIHAPDAVLGRALFWDKRISADGKTACASCHSREDYGGDHRVFSRKATGELTSRNSQTVFNATLQPTLRWTGNRKSGAEQAEKSLTGSMGLASPEAAVQLLRELGYAAAFRQAYPNDAEPISAANYGRAIEAYEKTLKTPAAFERFLAGDNEALTATQKTGLTTFLENGCSDCHSGVVFGGGSLEKFGVVKDYWTATSSQKVDLGRFAETQVEKDRHVFRVSMLRNIAKTGPYFHDGSVAQLKDAVEIMADVQLGIQLSEDETVNIVEFLNSLTGQVPAHFAPPALSKGQSIR